MLDCHMHVHCLNLCWTVLERTLECHMHLNYFAYTIIVMLIVLCRLHFTDE